MLLKNILLVWMLTIIMFAHADDTPQKYIGTWTGAWHEGMTSGTLWLTFQPNGNGSIRFTNLAKFGTSERSLTAIRFLGNRINFSANGQGVHDFVSHVFLIGGNKLRGNAEFDGLALTYRLSKK
ncbi:MAG: hypothetical protein H2061_02090 [Burkholderiales bacterium]|nr:hypothetical protein [Burkholderiales bacterium]OUT77536.1 MAG: hypothetical protein CBB82_05145 [Betaproteobacteria bacterium TMED22]|tara:strand:+ start:138 stop:509 length:372 start_codon:yes stop_codon:yes gene_type:complete